MSRKEFKAVDEGIIKAWIDGEPMSAISYRVGMKIKAVENIIRKGTVKTKLWQGKWTYNRKEDRLELS